jgi:TonB family protein
MGLSRKHKFRLQGPSRLQWFFLLSVLAHALVLYRRSVDYPVHTFSENPPVELTELSPEEVAKLPPIPKPKDRVEPEVAETDEAPNNQLDPDAQILSSRNQKVDQQTKAALIDDYRKKQGTGMKNSVSRQNTAPPTGETDAAIARKSDDALEGTQQKKQAGVKRNWKTLTLRDLGLGGDGGPTAATDDRLNNIAKGENTVLSTREFKFFSYYHRIKETLRQYWKPNVERKLAMLWGRGTRMKEAELVTQVLVMLDSSGTVARISKVNSSGFDDLDEAAIDAFNQAAPFPNPPQGMIDPDGYVRIRWDFILKTEASPQISFRGAGNGRRAP